MIEAKKKRNLDIKIDGFLNNFLVNLKTVEERHYVCSQLEVESKDRKLVFKEVMKNVIAGDE